MDSYEPELMNDYDAHMRYYLLKYVLHDPYEWRRLKIQTFPAEYPTMIICAPVPWHISYVLAKQLLVRHLFISNIIMTNIRDLWTDELVP